MSKEQEAIERLEYLERVLGYTMIQAGEIIGEQGKYDLANDIKTVLNMLKEKDKEMDLMAETIRKLAISLANYRGSYNEETFNFTGNIKDIKQYFERKATNDG